MHTFFSSRLVRLGRISGVFDIIARASFRVPLDRKYKSARVCGVLFSLYLRVRRILSQSDPIFKAYNTTHGDTMVGDLLNFGLICVCAFMLNSSYAKRSFSIKLNALWLVRSG